MKAKDLKHGIDYALTTGRDIITSWGGYTAKCVRLSEEGVVRYSKDYWGRPTRNEKGTLIKVVRVDPETRQVEIGGNGKPLEEYAALSNLKMTWEGYVATADPLIKERKEKLQKEKETETFRRQFIPKLQEIFEPYGGCGFILAGTSTVKVPWDFLIDLLTGCGELESLIGVERVRWNVYKEPIGKEHMG